ncbi:MAG: biopolymer transporter ExbD [Pontiellaceae bacterium]|nr:biopolymer transporter ExbD [Pontiellaceae bacterium]
MNLHSKEADEEVEIDMSPMIDMVFLLLIFFIVASKIIADKPPVDVPYAKAVKIAVDPKVVKGIDDKVERFMISISKDEDNERHYYLPDSADTTVTFDEMIEGMEMALNRTPKDKEFTVVLRGDGEVKFEDTQKVMKACADMGVYKMIFAAKEENK